ncbi:MAG TPA: CHRD domain-containing protein [Usitatibacter sp.]|nr:CHRD domain-containing protein [Usitatibacter sp.]
MRAFLGYLASAAAAIGLASGCGGTDSKPNTMVVKAASLNGAQETPAVTTMATGTAVFTIDTDSGAISGTVNTSNIDATVAHIHEGPVGVLSPVIIPLTKGDNGTWTVPDGTTLTPSQLDSLKNGNLYVNVHTAANPTGEIRGQIGRQVFFASLAGAQETPPTGSTATGTGVFIFDPATSTMSGTVTTTGITGTVAHMHIGAIGQAASPAIPFGGGPTSWTMSSTVLTEAQVTSLNGGNFYANVHSAANPGGEIRGQLYFPVRFANLSGEQETPSNSSAGTGAGVLSVNPFTRAAAGRMTWSGVIATDAHIHNAAPGTPGGIVIRGTVVAGDKGSLAINTPGALADNLLIAFMQNNLYYNVHSATFPSGEIRGQLAFTP